MIALGFLAEETNSSLEAYTVTQTTEDSHGQLYCENELTIEN